MHYLHADSTSLLNIITKENPVITAYLCDTSLDMNSLIATLKEHYQQIMQQEFPNSWAYYTRQKDDEQTFFKLSWREFAFIRIMDYLDNEGRRFEDGNVPDQPIISEPIRLLRDAIRAKKTKVSVDFVLDALQLLRQLNGKEEHLIPSRVTVQQWMARHPSALDEEVKVVRDANKKRIIKLLIADIRQLDKGAYRIPKEATDEQALELVDSWWQEDRFHLTFALRSSEEVNRYLDNSLDEKRKQIMDQAQDKGIPIFATPYFLSLIDIRPVDQQEHPYSDEALKSYLFYSQDLIDEFGTIKAWEKEDEVEVGKPNEAGWVLPTHTLHRRYPSVAIFIPDTMGRACGGLCAYCQRMYDFQKGRFNFDLEHLKPRVSWPTILDQAMEYFATDPYLEDILITGGDALMSSVASLKRILDAVLAMAQRKRAENENRQPEKRLAEMKRVRLGTKLPIYLPQRITKELAAMLKGFRIKAKAEGIEQCIIQTHFSSAMEISVDSLEAIQRLQKAGWAVTNQMVFTVAASRRGHTAKLRKVLNDIGVLPYYTFTVKGFRENRELFANNSRSMQEQIEEKSIGRVDLRFHSTLRTFIDDASQMVDHINEIRSADQIPFLATDRNTINLPAVGKSNTYRTIGITADGRRILEFEFDHTRSHSPAIKKMDPVVIIESKSLATYVKQLQELGEEADEYQSIWGFSCGRLEMRSAVFKGMSN